MKSILIVIACVIALPFGLLGANELSDLFHSRDNTCLKCDAKIKHVCPACHGHFMINPYGTHDGRYARLCSGCLDEPNNCCHPKKK